MATDLLASEQTYSVYTADRDTTQTKSRREPLHLPYNRTLTMVAHSSHRNLQYETHFPLQKLTFPVREFTYRKVRFVVQISVATVCHHS